MARIPFISRSFVNLQKSTGALARGKKARQSALHHAVIETLEGRQLLSVSLISVNSAGVAGNGASDEASVSSDGTFVAFSSYSTNLGGTAQSGIENIYLRDTATNTTTLVSAGLNGAASNGNSNSPKVSANGQFVVFASAATNLASNDMNKESSNVYLYNSANGGTITCLTGNANGFSGEPVISADGNMVAFSSYAQNLTANANNGHDNVYELNLTNNHYTLVSTAAGTTTASNGTSFDPSISGGGAFVTFRSTATNLENTVPVANSGGYNVYISNVGANTISLVSVNSAGAASGDENSISAQTSDNGQFVVFRSSANNLVANDNNNNDDVFLRNTTTNTTTLLSVDYQHTGAGHGLSEFPSISDDGVYAAFSSTAPDLVVNDSSTTEQVYVTDLATGTTYLISVDAATGAPANGASNHTFESSDGNFVTFTSSATDLTSIASNSVAQVYIATAPQSGGGTTNPGSPTPTPTTPTPTPTADTTPPTAVVSASQTPPTDGSTTYQFSVNLSDNVALNTVALGPLVVTGPAGTQNAAFIGEFGSGVSAVATYQITFPSGITAAFDGTYTVGVPAGSVKDAAGNDLTTGQTAPVSIGTFSLTAAPVDSPDLQGVFKGKFPVSVVGGAKGSATLVVSNQGVNPVVKTPVSFALYASETTTVLPGATPVKVVTSKLNLKHGKATTIKFSFVYPRSLPSGNYFLVADLDSSDKVVEINKVNNIVSTASTITIAPPFNAIKALSVVPNTGKAFATVTFQNAGNVTANGALTINLTAPTGAGDVTGTGEAVATVVSRIHLGAGKTEKLKVKYTVSPSVTAQSGFLSATLDPANVFKNPDQNANIATSAAGISIT
jgi:hypothetical protein